MSSRNVVSIMIAVALSTSMSQSASAQSAPTRFETARAAVSAWAPDSPNASQVEPSRPSGAPVLWTAVMGAVAGGVVMSHVNDDQEDEYWAAGIVSGATLGGLVGSHFGYRRSAWLHTIGGGVLAGIPLLILARSNIDSMPEGMIAVPLVVLPIVGTWLGNSLGQ